MGEKFRLFIRFACITVFPVVERLVQVYFQCPELTSVSLEIQL